MNYNVVIAHTKIYKFKIDARNKREATARAKELVHDDVITPNFNRMGVQVTRKDGS